MTREDLEKAAVDYFRGIDVPLESEIADFAIKQINAVIDMAVYRIDRHFGIDQDGNHDGIDTDDPIFIRDEIRALKIGETK